MATAPTLGRHPAWGTLLEGLAGSRSRARRLRARCKSMMRNRRRQRLRGAVTLLVLSGANWFVNPPAGAESLLGNGRVLYERDFTRSSRLAATPKDVVLLELEPRGGLHRPGDGSGPGRLRENRARYRLDAGTYTFCLEPNEPALVRLTLEDQAGRAVLRLTRDIGQRVCASHALPAGLYRLRAFHDPTRVTGASRLGFVHAGPVGPPLTGPTGEPVGGFWALRPEPGQGRVTLAPAPWSPVGDLFEPLVSHTATLLPSGRLLVAGGTNGIQQPTANAELYDPASGQWALTGTMTTVRTNHTATLLLSGRVLAAGGFTREGIGSSAELYDPATGRWSPTGAMRVARLNHTATLLTSGQVLVAGGADAQNNSTASAELYDPATGLWTLTGALGTARQAHTATLLTSGQVLVAGGQDSEGNPTASAELYDPATGQWMPTGALGRGRDLHTATLLTSGQVLVAGGADTQNNPIASAELYDPATGQWTPTGALIQGRIEHAATLLASGRVLISGGTTSFNPFTPLASAELYDPTAGTWASTGSLGRARWGHTATLLGSDQVLAAGGSGVDAGGSVQLASTELYAAAQPAIADGASARIDETALFSFADPTRPLAFLLGGRPLDLRKSGASGLWTLFADVDTSSATRTFFQDATPLVVTDLGHYRAQLGVKRADLGILANLFLGATAASPTTLMLNYDQPLPDPAPPVPVQVLFRFFPEGTPIGELREGEVAIYQQCNYQGKAAVFATDTPSLAALTSPVVTLDKTAASIRLGNNTGVLLYTASGYAGQSQTVELDTPCLDATPIGSRSTSSLQVRPLAPTILLASRSCEHCQLVGVDLRGLDLSGVDLRGAHLEGALASPNAAGQATDLSGATLTQARLRGAELTGVVLTGALLDGADLTGASLTDVSLGPAFTWQGAVLDHVTGLAGSDQSQANLSGVSLKGVDLKGARLYGTVLDNSELEGANLSAAFLTSNPAAGFPAPASLIGAHLKNVNLSGADLSGANLSFASFYGPAVCGVTPGSCANASGATMNNTQFSGAYLVNAHFSSTTIKGVQFQNAVLIGATFAHANISVNASTDTGFGGAFLQGADLASAASLDGPTLADAFVDFRQGGNSGVLQLDGNHTAFPGWTPAGQSVCVLFSYSTPTSVPPRNTTLTCPDGQSASAGGCGQISCSPATDPACHWKSPVDISQTNPPVSYNDDATYTPKSSPICAPPDFNW